MTSTSAQKQSLTTARITGVWYLVLAISGMVGFLLLHPKIYISADPEKTLANLTMHVTLARIRLLLEFAIILSQALAAVWFYKLFKPVSDWGAWALGVWGMMNAAAILLSAISMGSAIEIAISSNLPKDDKIVSIQLLGQLIKHSWGAGGLFFGLWLLPMGYMVVLSKRMPVWLGRFLILGGIGYILSTFATYSGFVNPWLEYIVIPATIGEFWMIGYLLLFGIRPLVEQSEV
ncbi:DUF4386 domain-containing protein [Flavihumibacter fluvii]|uniref:DUF4386 domain-containing protein n=1 Tax=Flavihumibacter fluvii TaxID=2838157 RepID=UPI001BDF349E|nr:DUF4386 domain-containing protein [Flavihumibacter fluvii]ULQ54008.1 DUF4386 domain-containing protein [Flavihumibacter fluvii]